MNVCVTECFLDLYKIHTLFIGLLSVMETLKPITSKSCNRKNQSSFEVIKSRLKLSSLSAGKYTCFSSAIFFYASDGVFFNFSAKAREWPRLNLPWFRCREESERFVFHFFGVQTGRLRIQRVTRRFNERCFVIQAWATTCHPTGLRVPAVTVIRGVCGRTIPDDLRRSLGRRTLGGRRRRLLAASWLVAECSHTRRSWKKTVNHNEELTLHRCGKGFRVPSRNQHGTLKSFQIISLFRLQWQPFLDSYLNTMSFVSM